MPESDISDITSTYNFINKSQIGQSGGIWQVQYHYLSSKTELSASIGYDVITGSENSDDRLLQNIEYGTFQTTTTLQRGMFDIILGAASGYNYSFSNFYKDVVGNINFQSGTAAEAQINIGQATWDSNGNGPADDTGAIAYMKNYYNPWEIDWGSDPSESGYAYSLSQPDQKVHGDIWLNTDFFLGWNSTAAGGYQFWSVLHELGHALGLRHPLDASIDNQKYSMMSYGLLDGMDVSGTTNNDVLPHGLQLYDIAALQFIYQSRNYSTRSEDTTYDAGHGLNANVNNPFI